jgi:histidinol dehydrogenase
VRSELIVPGASGPGEIAARLRRDVPAGESVAPQVAEILAEVRRGGDAAVTEFTRRFDTGGAEPPPVPVTEDEFEAAVATLAPDVRAGLELAIANVGRVARAGLREDRTVSFERHEVVLREAPVRRAAVYVPGGRAAYPSTVVMGVATARAAGVTDVAVCTPPGREATVNPVILAACALAGAGEVLRIGGAHAIAALAYGTETIAPADVIVGPGSLYVQEAKRQLSGQVGIDSFAGPSDLLVIADGDAELEQVALDLLAQAEHGAGTIVVATSPSADLLVALQERIASVPDTGAVVALVQASDLEDALALAEAFAPEHLELIGMQAGQLAKHVTRSGCVFVGAQSGTAFGDYIAGSNHTLPTGGAARFASALGPQHFRRSFSEVRIADGTALARAAAPIARAEGFELHARSMEARIRENGSG